MGGRLDFINWRLALCPLLLAGWLASTPAAAQDLEPRRWAQLPIGTNTLTIGYAGQDATIYFNPMIGITDGTANVNAWLARYTYSFEWSGKTARVDAILPYVSGTWQGLVDGEPGRRTIHAGSDPWLRLSVILHDAPALGPQALADYVAQNPVRTIIGVSLAVSPPLGGYDPKELINISTNRYAVRPQLGVLQIRGPWSVELTGSVFLFGDNDDYVESLTLKQDPVYAFQGHLTRTFNGNLWLGVGMAYAAGGRVQLEGLATAYKVDNLLWNLVGGYRVTPHQNVVLAWQQGRTQNESGSDFDSWLLSWTFVWAH